jgi:hypothetical protein
MQNWHWFALGIGVGYLVAKSGGSGGFGFSLSTGAGVRAATPLQGGDAGFLASGAGIVPLHEPRGSMPYEESGDWDALIPGGFPAYPAPGEGVMAVDGGPIQ